MNSKLIKFVYFATRVLLAVSFVLFVFRGNFESAFSSALIFGAILAPSILKKRFNFQLPFELDVAIGLFVFLTLFLGSLHGYYERFPWWDTVLHFQSGILLGILGFVVIYILNSRKASSLNLSPGFISFFSVCFSLSVGVLWEIYEYSIDTFFGFTMQETSLHDTMSDLIVNGIGAIIVAVIAYVWMKREMKLPFTPFTLEERN